MLARNKKNPKNYPVQSASTGLSPGVLDLNHKRLDKNPHPFWDLITQAFLFLLGGVILCGIILALVSFT
ncbi:hypothetical protein QWY22_11605 [Planococcus liqunii]|uniref:hypothetical protein n=1 Tax=Planococcus liqunii TaxID=3058394 RepID=UPI0026223D7F|nr:hypothetical protein [Planococcus sp. N056]WKA49548.1 hypothetical protein QWY22_11605 [Planococcus sp. N056]